MVKLNQINHLLAAALTGFASKQICNQGVRIPQPAPIKTITYKRARGQSNIRYAAGITNIYKSVAAIIPPIMDAAMQLMTSDPYPAMIEHGLSSFQSVWLRMPLRIAGCLQLAEKLPHVPPRWRASPQEWRGTCADGCAQCLPRVPLDSLGASSGGGGGTGYRD
jgi:hypothetical protein